MNETPETPVTANGDLLESVNIAFSRANRYVSWRSKCYEQAIAAKMILRGYGLESTLYYGVAKDAGGQLLAHAWLRCGDYIVTGRMGMDQFTVVGTFG